jgi:methylthioribose-1-phosphate isomerase
VGVWQEAKKEMRAAPASGAYGGVCMRVRARERESARSLVHTVHSLVHTVHSLVHTVHSLVHTVHSLVHTVHSLKHTVHSLVHTVHSLVHTVHARVHKHHTSARLVISHIHKRAAPPGAQVCEA